MDRAIEQNEQIEINPMSSNQKLREKFSFWGFSWGGDEWGEHE